MEAKSDALKQETLLADSTIKLLAELKEERQLRLEAEQKNKQNQSKILFADAIVSSGDTILIGILANVLKQNGVNMGQNRLFEWMRENRYLCKRGERRNQPTQRSMELGVFEISYNAIVRPSKSVHTMTTKVTGKGQIYFVEKFLGKKKAP